MKYGNIGIKDLFEFDLKINFKELSIVKKEDIKIEEKKIEKKEVYKTSTSFEAYKNYEIEKYKKASKTIEFKQFMYVQNILFSNTQKNEAYKLEHVDDISYVDINGKTGRVMHSGVKYNERNNSQPASTVPKGASLSDILLPTDNVYFVPGQYGAWREGYLIPCIYRKEVTKQAEAPSYIGKKMTIMMPIIIENVQNDYTFVFNIDKLMELNK